MNAKDTKPKPTPVKALDRERLDSNENKKPARDWHTMSEEEQLEVLSHLSDMPFQ